MSTASLKAFPSAGNINSLISQTARIAAFKANYYLGNYQDVIWLVGDGRSGTTWISELLNHQHRYRDLFEPFHPNYAGHGAMFAHQYVRPGTTNELLERMARDVFKGKLYHPRVDESNNMQFYKGLVVKDIFANLFAYWAWQNNPQVKPILLIRNPFAVALSKFKKSHWFWVTDPMDLLNQVDLFEDHLSPFADDICRISREGDYISKQIQIWSIINYIPLKQFKSDELHVVFYEETYADPQQKLAEMMSFIRPERGNLTAAEVNQGDILRPSRYSGQESNLLVGKSPVEAWKDELSVNQIDEGLKVLELFGFAELYREDLMPDWQVLKEIVSAPSRSEADDSNLVC